ncbi:MAG: YncE family protein [Methanosarcina sp.]
MNGVRSGSVVVSSDGTRVYVTDWVNNTISKLDTGTSTVTQNVNVGNYPGGLAVSPNGSKLYATNSYYDENSYSYNGYVSVTQKI